MPQQHVLEPAQAVVSIAIVLIVLLIHVVLASRALADLWRDDRLVRLYPKQTWALVITLVGIIGPVAYFSFGRDGGA
jgi:hypothetical protein